MMSAETCPVNIANPTDMSVREIAGMVSKREKVVWWDQSKSLEMRKLGYRSRGSQAEMRPYNRRRRCA
jgi:hypothetical protein